MWDGYERNKLWQSLEGRIQSWEEIKNNSVNEKCDWLLKIISESTNQFKKTKSIKPRDEFFDN